MVFARKSRSDAGRSGGPASAPAQRRESRVERRAPKGKEIDPFNPEDAFADPDGLAEKVVFKLWSEGAVKGRAIEQARREASDKFRLDQALTRLRLAAPDVVASALAEQLGAPLAQERDYPEHAVLSEMLPGRFVREALALPMADDGETLVLALADPLDEYTLRAIAMKTRRRLAVTVACAGRLEREIERIYQLGGRRGARQKALPSPERAIRDARPATGRPARAQAETAGRGGAAIVPAIDQSDVSAPPRDGSNRARPAQEPMARRSERGDPARKRARRDTSPGEVAPQINTPRVPSPHISSQEVRSPSVPPALRRSSDLGAAAFAPAARRTEASVSSGRDARSDQAVSGPSTRGLRPARGAAADPREGARRARPFGAGEPPVSIEDAVAETSRSLAQSLNEEVSAHPARQEPRARQEPPARRQEPPARLEGQDARPAATQGASARDGAADVAPVRPNFIRPRHVTRKDMTRKDSSSQENGRVVEQTDPGGARPLIERVRAELDGATRTPAPRRPLGPKAISDDVSAGDDPSTTPLRSGEVDGHASVARSRTSQARRKLLAEVRKVISPRRDAEAHEADPSVVSDREDGRALRYQASDAAAARQRSGAQDPPASEISSPEPLAQAPEALKTRLRADGPPRAPVAETIGAVPQLARPNALDLAAALAALPEVDHADEGLILLVGPSGSGKIATARALAERRAAGVTKAQRFDEPGAAPARPQHAKIDENGDRDDEPVFTVYWGEIRDAESAEAAARAAMGGALVIAALDAPNTAAAPPRLIELGLPPYALASSLRAVATQRLEERGCTRCAETGRDVRGEVCAECGGAGRIEIVEIGETLILDDATRALILSDAPEEAFQHAIAAARPQPTKRPPAPALERLLEIGASPRA